MKEFRMRDKIRKILNIHTKKKVRFCTFNFNTNDRICFEVIKRNSEEEFRMFYEQVMNAEKALAHI